MSAPAGSSHRGETFEGCLGEVVVAACKPPAAAVVKCVIGICVGRLVVRQHSGRATVLCCETQTPVTQTPVSDSVSFVAAPPRSPQTRTLEPQARGPLPWYRNGRRCDRHELVWRGLRNDIMVGNTFADLNAKRVHKALEFGCGSNPFARSYPHALHSETQLKYIC